MQNRSGRNETARFRRRFSILTHLFWIAAVLNALYIAGYVLALVLTPEAAWDRGQFMAAVPRMTEHVLMSVLLLTAFGAAEETVFRSE